MTEATVTTNGERASLRLERHLVDPPEVVWRAITDRDQLRSWFPCDVEVVGGVWQVGAAIVFRFPPEVIDVTLHGDVLAVEVPALLSFSWGEEILRFELTEMDSGTRLVLTDELPPAIAARSAAGWDSCLARLAGQRPDEEFAWKASFDKYTAAFSPLLGTQDGPPVGHKLAH
jgi:uncharacterized protein YndB with AHSA1/START domain